MEDLLPHTTADMVAPAPTAASRRRRRSVRGRQSRYSPPPVPDTIWPAGVRPVRPSSRGDPRRDGAWVWARGRRAGGARGRRLAGGGGAGPEMGQGDSFGWLVLSRGRVDCGAGLLGLCGVTTQFMDVAMVRFS
jgi:hypothetical protein